MTDTYTLINLDNLKHNAKTLTEKYSEYGTHIGIVKGDAYGHGYEAVNALYDGVYVTLQYRPSKRRRSSESTTRTPRCSVWSR